MVVDDDPDLLQLTTEVLKQHYRVISFSNAEQALQSLSSEYFDLLITDIQMPIKDGFEFIKELQKKKNYNYNNQPLIAVTGRADLKDEIYSQAGFIAVLKKPFTPNILLQTIDAVFNKTSLPIQETAVTAITNQEKLFSLDSLKLFLKNDKDALKTVVQSFINSTNSNLFILENTIQTLEHEKIKEVAHKMAPMFKQIEATEIAVILKKLESEEYNETELPTLFLDLKSKVRSLLIILEESI